MKKNLLETFKLLACCLLLVSQLQAQNSHWILAPNYYKTDMGFTPSSLPTHPTSVSDAYHGAAATSSQNIQTDASGNILFFIVDDKVYDRNGKRIVGTESGYTTDNLFSTLRGNKRG